MISMEKISVLHHSRIAMKATDILEQALDVPETRDPVFALNESVVSRLICNLTGRYKLNKILILDFIRIKYCL